MIWRLLESIQTKNNPCDSLKLPDELEKHSLNTGLDWIFIDCVKWALACDKIGMPEALSLGRLAGVLAGQLQKKVTQLGALVRYEAPKFSKDGAELTAE